MTFQFDSWQAFWAMGGYGFYVWLAFAVSLLAVGALIIESVWAKKRLVAAVGAQIARKQRIQQHRQAQAAKRAETQPNKPTEEDNLK